MNKLILCLLYFLFCGLTLTAQCDEVNPTISSPRLDSLFAGSVLLCNDNDSELLSTQAYDSYQWYRQAFSTQNSNQNPWVAIEDAVNQTFEANSIDLLLNNIKVEVKQGACTAESTVILIDGYEYLPATMLLEFEEGATDPMRSGDEIKVCSGSKVKLSNIAPVVYGKHTWYECLPSVIPPSSDDPCILDGLTSDSILVEQSGVYGFYACTDYCPANCNYLGDGFFADLNFGDWEFCTTSSHKDMPKIQYLKVFPNPTQASLMIDVDNPASALFEVTIYDTKGSVITTFSQYELNTPIDISRFDTGTYVILLSNGKSKFKSTFVKY